MSDPRNGESNPGKHESCPIPARFHENMTVNSLPGHVARSRRFVEESHLLGHDQLEAIRLLTNHDLDSSSPFACLLVGQPTLRRRMKLSVLAALDQRIGLRYAMPPMTFLPTNQTGCDYSVFVGCHAAQASHLSPRSNPFGHDKVSRRTQEGFPQRSTRRCRHRPIPTTADGRPTCRSVTVMDRRHCRRGLDLSPAESDAYDGNPIRRDTRRNTACSLSPCAATALHLS